MDEELLARSAWPPAGTRHGPSRWMSLQVADAMDGGVRACSRRANKYIDETMPWVLGKDEEQESSGWIQVLYNLLESIRLGRCACWNPFCRRPPRRSIAQLNTSQTSMESLEQFGALQPGDTVGQAEILFARLDLAKKMEEVNAYNAAKNPAPAKKSCRPMSPKLRSSTMTLTRWN